MGYCKALMDRSPALADRRAGMRMTASCGSVRCRTEPQQPLVSLKAAVRVGQRVDEVRGSQVGGQLGYDHGLSMQAAGLGAQHNYAALARLGGRVAQVAGAFGAGRQREVAVPRESAPPTLGPGS